MGFCVIQMKGQGNDDWERVKWCITCQFIASDHYTLTCTPFIRVQVGIVDYCFKPTIKLFPCYPRRTLQVHSPSWLFLHFLCGRPADCSPIHSNCALCIDWIFTSVCELSLVFILFSSMLLLVFCNDVRYSLDVCRFFLFCLMFGNKPVHILGILQSVTCA